MSETTAGSTPDLSGIRDLAVQYGTGYMTEHEQAEVIDALFVLCECVEHVLAYAAEVERLAREHIEGIRSTA